MLATSFKQSNYQDLLKTLATIAMIIDHIDLYFYLDSKVMGVIGSIAMPIFCFCAGYNFHEKKPDTRIFLHGVFLQIYTTLLFKEYEKTNVLLSIFFGQCYIYYFRRSITRSFYSCCLHVIITAISWIISSDIIEFGTLVFAVMILGFVAKHEPNSLNTCCFITIFSTLIILSISFHDINIPDPYLYLNIILLIATYKLMTISDYSKIISVNLNWISRNSLDIYCVHLMIIRFLSSYK